MNAVKGIVKEIRTRSVDKTNGQTSLKNYSTVGGTSSITNSQVVVGKTPVSFTKSKNFQGFKFSKGDELIVVGDMIEGTLVAVNYHNVTKNITEAMKNSFIALYGFITLSFLVITVYIGYKILTDHVNFVFYFIGAIALLLFILFGVVTYTALNAKLFLLKEIKKHKS